MHLRPILVLLMLFFAAASAAAACSDETSGTGSGSEIVFEGQAEPLAGFSYDTGLVPKVSPAQVQLQLSAAGAAKVTAAGTRGDRGLVGKPGGGNLSLDVHVKMGGRLKVVSTIKSYDGELPGVKDIDIPIAGSVPFDPFLLEDGQTATVEATVPPTKLPPIPLGGVPGNLELSIESGSVVRTSFHGTCLAIAGGDATYSGETETTGTLVLKGTIAVALPAPLNKAVDLGEIKVPIPALRAPVAFAPRSAAGAVDGSQGRCGAPGSGADGGGQDGGADGGTCTDLANTGSSVTLERVSGAPPAPTGGAITPGTYTLLSIRAYDGSAAGTFTVKRTIRVGASTIEGVTEDEITGDVERASGVYVASGTTMARSYTCPDPPTQDSPGYTSTGSTLVLVFATERLVYTYGRR